MIHFHKWLKWSEFTPGFNGEKLQFRVCETCGKRQKRSLGYCQGANFHEANKVIDKTLELVVLKLNKGVE